MTLFRKHDFRSCIRTAAPLAGVLCVGLLVLTVLLIVQEIVPSYGKVDQTAGQPPTNTLKINVQKCSSAADIQQKVTLEGPSCPLEYPPVTVQDVLAGISRSYTFGGIDRLGCKACNQKGLWPRFCLFRRTGVKFWDDVNCNMREDFGQDAILKSVQLSSNLTLNWPSSGGMTALLTQQAAGRNISAARLASAARTLAPGPVEITPCHVWRIIRGRTLWLIGDSQMKSLYVAIKCFMLEFWLDFKQYRPTWNSTINDYLESGLPINAEAACIHMRDSTRICQLVVTSAGLMVRGPARRNGTVAGDSIWQLLQKQLATPDDIFAMNFGLWYKSWTPEAKDFYRHHLNALGAFYNQTLATFPNVFFLETVKLHYPYPAGEQDGMVKNATQCAAAQLVELNYADSRLIYTESETGQVSPAALEQAKKFMQFQRPKNASTTAAGKQRRLAGARQQQQQSQWQKVLGNASSATSSNDSSINGSSSSSGSTYHNSSSSNSTAVQLQAKAADLATSQNMSNPSKLQGFNNSSSSGNSSRSSSNSTKVSASSSNHTVNSTGTSKVGSRSSRSDTFAYSGHYSNSTANSSGSSSGDGSHLTNNSAAIPSKNSSHSSAAANNQSSSGSNSKHVHSKNMTSRNRSAGKSSSSPAAGAAATAKLPSNLAPEIAAAGPVPRLETQQVKALAIKTQSGTETQDSDVVPPVLSPEAAAALVLAGTWRNDIAREVLRDKWGMPWVPIYNTTVPAYWGHRNQPDSPDCIHYCNPGVPQNIMSQLMLAIAVQVQPLEGQTIADKTCLWGTEQVYDEHEQLFAENNTD